MATARAKATPKPSTKSPVVIDKKVVAAWKEENAIYEASRQDESRGWDVRYESLGRILDGNPPLYLAGGFKTAREFLAVCEPDRSERTVRSYIRVARHFEPQHEDQFGIVKLETLIDILEAQNGGVLPDARIDPATQTVSVPNGKGSKKIRFAEAGVEQLRSALRLARGQARKPSPADSPRVRALREALVKAGVKAVGVQVRDGKLSLTGIPLDQAGAVGKVLTRWKAK